MPPLLNHRDRRVAQVDVFPPGGAAGAGLRDQSPLRVVVVEGVALGIGLADALADTVHLVGGAARAAGSLDQAPAAVVGEGARRVIRGAAVTDGEGGRPGAVVSEGVAVDLVIAPVFGSKFATALTC
jgi:hypothetical protein